MILSEGSRQLLRAVSVGPIRAIGGTVYNVAMRYLCNTSDLKGYIDELAQYEIIIGRTDSGGQPTWDLKSVPNYLD